MNDQKLLNKGLALLPDLYESYVEAERTVAIAKDGQGAVCVGPAESCRTRLLKKGDSVVLDFGDHQVGYLSLKFGTEGSHADAPVLLRLHFAEVPAELLEDAETYHGWICSSWIEEERIHVDVLPGEIALPRRYAFRYVRIEILDISSKFSLRVEKAVCRAVSSVRKEDLLPYRNPDPRFQKLDRIACRTLQNCMQKVFEDGPKRDRRLWMGDLRIQALVNYETYRKNDLVKACLYIFAGLPAPGGQVGGAVFLEPEPAVDDVAMLDYSLFFVCALRDYYRASGDEEALKDLWPTALSQIYLAESALTDEDLIRDSDELGWCFIDWNLALNKQGAAQGVFLYALRAAIQLAKILDESSACAKLQTIYQSCRDAANRLLWDPERNCYVSGKDRQVSVATQAWMVLGGAVEGEDAADLLRRVTEMQDAVEIVSPYMMHNYVEALITAGEQDEAIDRMCAYWGGMADRGADTFWELYNPANPDESPYGGTIVNSYCHAWSCGPAYFLRKYRP